MEIQRFGTHGIAVEGSNVLTFEIQGLRERDEIFNASEPGLYQKYMNEYSGIRLKDFLVPAWGDSNNLYPQAVYNLITQNKLIPQIIEKQVEYMYGKGPYLYVESVVDKDIIREPVEDVKIQDWLDSWEKNGLKPAPEYLLQLILEYYHVPAIASKYHFAKSRRLVGFPGINSNTLPIIGLEAMSLDTIRLATKEVTINRRIKDSDCKYVIKGDWLNPSREDFEVFDRFIPSDPYRFNTAISFSKNKTFTKDIYPLNQWFEGLFHWIKGANLTPQFINSYLKNALNARIHVLIPGAWVEKQKEIISSLCEQNRFAEVKIPTYCGVKLINPETGTEYEFNELMVEQLINNKLKEITRLMSGEGKNQGKLWASIKYNIGNNVEEWDFKEIPSNYKEFIESLTSYDKRADQVILAGLGINSSISNVEKDGVISKSGSDVFYNYMIYINNLAVPEYFICQDINRAIALNFPGTKVKLGLFHKTPPKTSEISPSNRMEEE